MVWVGLERWKGSKGSKVRTEMGCAAVGFRRKKRNQ